MFDQFEEIFTVGQGDARSARFLDALEELIENLMPFSVRRRIEAGEDVPFADQRRDFRVVVSLREDFLPAFEELMARMPSLMHQRMRLSAMNGRQALEAIQRPAIHLVDHQSACEIVRFVAGAGQQGGADIEPDTGLENLVVEPALLSLVCFELNRVRLAHGLPRIDTQLFGLARTGILARLLRALLETPADRTAGICGRPPPGPVQAFAALCAMEDALRLPGVTKADLNSLINRRLLRIEMHLGIPHLELRQQRTDPGDPVIAPAPPSGDYPTRGARAAPQGRTAGVLPLRAPC